MKVVMAVGMAVTVMGMAVGMAVTVMGMAMGMAVTVRSMVSVAMRWCAWQWAWQ